VKVRGGKKCCKVGVRGWKYFSVLSSSVLMWFGALAPGQIGPPSLYSAEDPCCSLAGPERELLGSAPLHFSSARCKRSSTPRQNTGDGCVVCLACVCGVWWVCMKALLPLPVVCRCRSRICLRSTVPARFADGSAPWG
jgi:hypothetical protein